MLTVPDFIILGNQSEFRKKRQAGKVEAEQSRNILQPEMVCLAHLIKVELSLK